MRITKLLPGPFPSEVLTIEFNFGLRLGDACFNILSDQEKDGTVTLPADERNNSPCKSLFMPR